MLRCPKTQRFYLRLRPMLHADFSHLCASDDLDRFIHSEPTPGPSRRACGSSATWFALRRTFPLGYRQRPPLVSTGLRHLESAA